MKIAGRNLRYFLKNRLTIGHQDNDLRDGEGELLSAEDAKKELDARSVTVDGVEYFLLYVL